MTNEQKKLYESASDLWYTLHENNENEVSRRYLIEFLKLESLLLQSFTIDQRESRGEYKDLPITYQGKTGQDLAYSMLAVISLNESWINRTSEPILYKIFWMVSLLLTHPLSTEDWGDLINQIETLE